MARPSPASKAQDRGSGSAVGWRASERLSGLLPSVGGKGRRDEDSLSGVCRIGCCFRGIAGQHRDSAVAAETPFKGTVSAVETGTTVFPTRFSDRVGTGNATYLGRYTEHVTETINIPTMSSTGAATFTAANGDTLLATEVGQATRTSPTTLSIVEVYTVTGGTGRFDDATGSFTLESNVDQTTGAQYRHAQRSHRPLVAARAEAEALPARRDEGLRLPPEPP